MALVGDELYVGDDAPGRLKVFSLAGAHLRTIRGEWAEPYQLLHVDGRLYLSEFEDTGDTGHRIFVLTPQGETLQVWKPGEGEEPVTMAVLGRRLLVMTRPVDETSVSPKLIALKGL